MEKLSKLYKAALTTLVAVAVITFMGCQGITNPVAPTWVMEILGPLAKAEIDINSFSDFAAYTTTSEFGFSDMDSRFSSGTPYAALPSVSAPTGLC